MNSIVSVFLASLMAMIKIFLISCVGIACARIPSSDPILNKEALRHFSRLNTFVLCPALVVYSLGSTLTWSLFVHLSLLIPYGVAIVAVSYICGYLLQCVHEDNAKLFKSSLVCVGSPNGISLPIMVMSSLCENASVNADYDGDSEECFDESTSMMFIYCIPWLLFFWSCGYSTLASTVSEPLAPENCGESNSLRKNFHTTLSKIWNALYNPTLIGVYVGLVIGLVPGLGGYMFKQNTFLKPFGGMMEVLAEPVVALNSLVMAASLAHIKVNWNDVFPGTTKAERSKYEHQSTKEDTFSPMQGENQLDEDSTSLEISMNDVGIALTKSGGKRSRTSSNTSSDFDCSDVSSSLTDVVVYEGRDIDNGDKLCNEDAEDVEDGACLGLASDGSVESALDQMESIPQHRSIFFIVLCRLILCPLVITFLVYVSVQIGFIPEHLHLMQLLIIIESASPPAQMVIVVLNQLGQQGTASTVAYTYVFVYLFSILTITMWSTIAIAMIY